ncbi:MAG: hypothetical protein R6V77_03550, partial [Candidatus Cloacimonadaceae bacterium]
MNNRFLHFILAAVLLTAVIPMAAQTLIALGTGTDYNGPTIDPTPYGTYYKNFRQQYLYKASEIIAQGGTFGTITRLGFNIQAMNNCSEVPHYIIRIKHTSQNVLNTTFEIGEYTEVWHETFYVPTTTGWQNHTLTTPFVWDGTSNLLIDIVTTMAATATQNVSVYYTTAQLIPDYRSLRFQSNTLPAGSATTGILSHDYANLRMVIYSPILPANLVAPALGADAFCNVELTWSPGEGATPTGYRLYLGTDGGGTETPTNLVNGQDLGNVTTYSHPSFLENNTTLYWKIVPYVLGDEAEQCPIWNFNTSPLFGTFIIGPEGDFSNFTNAILFLNHSGVTAAGATFKVANQNFHEVLPPITASGTQTGRIIFEPLNETDNPKLALFSFPEATYGFKLEGADYVTINNIDLDGAGSMLYGYWLTDGATHCIIQNCAINVQFHTGPINYSIYSYGANSYSNFLNNVIYGDPFVAIAVTGLYGNRSISNQISDNLIDSGAAYGISIEYTDSTTIANNRIISSVDNNNTFKGIKKSIGSAAQIYGNHISGSTSSTMYGIFLEMGDCHV